MENSSRALFIAAGVILGVLLLSIMIYVFRQGARVNEAYEQKQITNQLELYNARFEAYDRNNNNIMDIISLANLAYDTNSACGFDTSVAVAINLKIAGKTFKIPKTKLSGRNIIQNYSGNEISIYNLTELTFDQLGISNVSLLGTKARKEDKLSTAKLVDGKTIYKYLFKVVSQNDFKYYTHSLKVSEITLKAYIEDSALW